MPAVMSLTKHIKERTYSVHIWKCFCLPYSMMPEITSAVVHEMPKLLSVKILPRAPSVKIQKQMNVMTLRSESLDILRAWQPYELASINRASMMPGQGLNTEALPDGCVCVCGGGGGYLFLCLRFPLFPKIKILIFYVPCSPKLPLFPSVLDFCSLVPLK